MSMHQDSSFTWRVFLATIILGSVAASYSPGLAMEFPQLNPPKIDRDIDLFGAIRPTSDFAKALPSLEWTFHKTADGVHPDGIEQQIMWLMNRARSNPTKEGVWLATTGNPDIEGPRTAFGVDLQLLQSEFAALSAKPPAAFDVRLYTAAKEHSEYLISVDDQNHDGQFDRVDSSGFMFLSGRGNVFSYTQSGIHGHAGFNIDWGTSSDGSGMQDGRGHRKAIMSIDGDYSNVGIAAIPENAPATFVGPLVVTGNYCSANTKHLNHHNRFLVGTVWKDMDGDAMYDPDEGVGGVTVRTDQGSYYAVTGKSGGYAIPVLAARTYRVTFTGPGIPEENVLTANVGQVSVLLDFKVPFAADAMPWLQLLLDGNK